MTVELIVSAAVSAGALLWGLRRRKQFETTLRALRDAHNDVTYAASAADSKHLAAIRADQTAIEACGFAVLGDIVRQVSDRRVAITRVFCDRPQTTCALVSVSPNTFMISLSLYSFADDQMFATHRGSQATLATPPFVHRQKLSPILPFAQIDDHHRKLSTAGPFVRIASRDVLIAELERLRAKIERWRATQPPDELLDADLRSVLGYRYAWWGKAWARRLRGRLPAATIRRG